MSVERKPKDRRRSRDIREFGELMERMIREAATSFPQGGNDTEVWEWCRVTSLLLFEMVKRKGCPPWMVIERSQRAVEIRLRREKADKLLALEVPYGDRPLRKPKKRLPHDAGEAQVKDAKAKPKPSDEGTPKPSVRNPPPKDGAD